MEYERKYLPGERKLYERMSPEEQKEWNSLSGDDRKFYLEAGKIDFSEIDNQIEKASKTLDKLTKEQDSFNKEIINLKEELKDFKNKSTFIPESFLECFYKK
jgi:chromosome segregation ATPase